MHKIDKIIVLPNANTFYKNDLDLKLFSKYTSESSFNSLTKRNNPKLGGTTFTVVDAGILSSYDRSFCDEEKSDLENVDRYYLFILDSFIRDQMITLEDLKSDDFKFKSASNINHYFSVVKGAVTIKADRFMPEGVILLGDIQATECIIHKIDKVLGPVKPDFAW